VVELATASLSAGAHVVTLRAFDPGAQQGEARVNVVIEGVPEAPSIQIERPVVGEDALEEEIFRFMVKVEDAQDPEPDLIVELRSDVEGFICSMTPDSTGIAYCEDALGLGEHLLTFSVEDTEGNANSASVVFEVVSPLDFDGDRDGWTPNQGDCNDDNNTIHPGAAEVCDNLDNDCSPITPIDAGTICYDDDGDNYCEAPPCRNASGTLPDCNDLAPGIYPGAPELPNGLDDDCNGQPDNGMTNFDDDGDGFCETPPCVNAAGTQPDCDDTRYLVNVNQTEICGDGLDNNCNFTQNERDALNCTPFYVDRDEDGFGVSGAQQCWCEAGGAAYPYGSTNTRDCYDDNPLANPNQTQYFASHRGDGVYDYDCNRAQEKQPGLTQSYACWPEWLGFSCDNNDGFVQGVPSCGNTGVWASDCGTCVVSDILGSLGCAFIQGYLPTFSCVDFCSQNDCFPSEMTSRTMTCR
jgi:hypothetical protein